MIGLRFILTALISTLLMAGGAVGQRPPAPMPTVNLRVAVNDRAIRDGESLALKTGQAAQLAVQVARKDGTVADITNDPKTYFVSFTPWTLSVSSRGVVTASGSTEYRGAPEYDIGVVGVRYGNPGDAEIGGATVLVEISPSQEVANAVGLHIKPPKTTLAIGETMQLAVIERLPDGSTRDLTSPRAGTDYDTTSESMLIPEPDGRVTCIGLHEGNWDVATVAAQNGKFRAKARLKLVAGGPGPSLQIVADKTVLREGERVQLHVFKPLAGGSRKELTTAATGTRYLTFAGFGVIDSSVVSVSGSGLAAATASIGSYNYRTVIVFVRNADDVGWIELKVSHGGGK
jgi:hypothetical protein